MSKKKGTSPAESGAEWQQRLASLSQAPSPPKAAESPDDLEPGDTWETMVLRDFRTGNLQFDESGHVVVGATAIDPDGVFVAMASSFNGPQATPIVLLNQDELYSVRYHFVAELIILSPEGRPVAAPGGTNNAAASVLAAYLDLALEAYARQVGQPRLDEYPAIAEWLYSVLPYKRW